MGKETGQKTAFVIGNHATLTTIVSYANHCIQARVSVASQPLQGLRKLALKSQSLRRIVSLEDGAP